MAKKDNSDSMSRKQDDQLEQLEERLTALYANAANEIKSKYTDFMEAYRKQDEQKRADVEAGIIPEDEYTAWRRTQMLNDARFTAAVESMTNTLINTDKAAMAAVNGDLPKVIAESYNYVTALGSISAEKTGITTGTFQIYNSKTVEKLITEKPNLFPAPSKMTIERLGGTVDIPEDKKWNKDRMTRELTQGIIQGEDINKISNRLERVTTMDRNAAVRNARTSYTMAENMGRSAAADELKAQGIPTEEVWSATYDKRTRDSHLLLDGTTRDESGYFGVGIIHTPLRFPGDPEGDPEEVYNCRCRLNIQLAGIDHSKDDELYEKFMKENHPDDWENLQNNEPYQARQAEAAATKERKAELRSQHQDLPKEKTEEKPEEKNPNFEYGGHRETKTKYFKEDEDEGIIMMTKSGVNNISKDLGVDKRRAEEIGYAMISFTGDEYMDIRDASAGLLDTNRGDFDWYQKKADAIEEFIDKSPKWDGGEISRGIFVDKGVAEEIKRQAESNEPISLLGISSWTSDRKTAEKFAETHVATMDESLKTKNQKKGRSVIFVNDADFTNYGTSVKHMSMHKSENEVLVSGNTEFKPTRVEETKEAIIIHGEIRRKKK